MTGDWKGCGARLEGMWRASGGDVARDWKGCGARVEGIGGGGAGLGVELGEAALVLHQLPPARHVLHLAPQHLSPHGPPTPLVACPWQSGAMGAPGLAVRPIGLSMIGAGGSVISPGGSRAARRTKATGRW